MISYAPLEEEPTERQPLIVRKKTNIQQTTECNTVVMIFIGGVLLLALMDSIH